jgi:hypothetical protein
MFKEQDKENFRMIEMAIMIVEVRRAAMWFVILSSFVYIMVGG